MCPSPPVPLQGLSLFPASPFSRSWDLSILEARLPFPSLSLSFCAPMCVWGGGEAGGGGVLVLVTLP